LRIWRYSIRVVYLLTVVVFYIPVMVVLLQPVAYAEAPAPGNDQQLTRQAEKIPGMIEDKVLEKSQIPNPHWRKDSCLACHVNEPDGGGSPLKAQTDQTCFYCHRKEEHTVIHPVNLAPGKKMLSRMPKEFRQNLDRGKETNCLTCHDVLMQCTKKRPSVMRLRNKSFVRGGYYNTRTGICYQCHNKAAYKKLNPHDQVSDKGAVDKDKCLICHKGVPKQDDRGATELTMQVESDWAQMCLNCHRWQPHPGGNMAMFSGGKPPNHLVVPDGRIRDRMMEMTQKNHLAMPLEPGSGKVYCATCHNPHERGVIKDVSRAKGADGKHRLRSQRICINCHDK